MSNTYKIFKTERAPTLDRSTLKGDIVQPKKKNARKTTPKRSHVFQIFKLLKRALLNARKKTNI